MNESFNPSTLHNPILRAGENAYKHLKSQGRSIEGFPLSRNTLEIMDRYIKTDGVIKGIVAGVTYLSRKHDREQLGNTDIPPQVRAAGTLLGTALLFAHMTGVAASVLELSYLGASENNGKKLKASGHNEGNVQDAMDYVHEFAKPGSIARYHVQDGRIDWEVNEYDE